MRSTFSQFSVICSLLWVGLLVSNWVIVKSDVELTQTTTRTSDDMNPTPTIAPKSTENQMSSDLFLPSSEIPASVTPTSESYHTSTQSSPDHQSEFTTSTETSSNSGSLNTVDHLSTTEKTLETTTSDSNSDKDKESSAYKKEEHTKPATVSTVSENTNEPKPMSELNTENPSESHDSTLPNKMDNEIKTTVDVNKSKTVVNKLVQPTSMEAQMMQDILSKGTTTHPEQRNEQVSSSAVQTAPQTVVEKTSLETNTNMVPNTLVSKEQKLENTPSTTGASGAATAAVENTPETKIVQTVSYKGNPKILLRAVGTMNKGMHLITSNNLLITTVMFVISRFLLSQ